MAGTQLVPAVVALAPEEVVEPELVVVGASLEEVVVEVAVVLLEEVLVAGIQAWAWSHHFFPLARTNLKSQELFQEQQLQGQPDIALH